MVRKKIIFMPILFVSFLFCSSYSWFYVCYFFCTIIFFLGFSQESSFLLMFLSIVFISFTNFYFIFLYSYFSVCYVFRTIKMIFFFSFLRKDHCFLCFCQFSSTVFWFLCFSVLHILGFLFVTFFCTIKMISFWFCNKYEGH